MRGERRSPFDPKIIASIRLLLTGIDDVSHRRAVTLRAEVSPDSLAAADEKLPDARYVTIYAGQALATWMDHMTAWRLLAHGPEIPIRAHLTLLRSALEGAVRSRWHVDASVDSGTRVGRGHAARRADQEERRKFEASQERGRRPGRPVRGRTAVERLAELDDPAAVRRLKAAGVRTVGFTDITTLMVVYRHERWFRLASGLAHGKEWALVATHLKRSSESLAPGIGQGTFSASEPVALALTGVVMGAGQAAVADLEAYRGTGQPIENPKGA
jgi:hypothetical protein